MVSPGDAAAGRGPSLSSPPRLLESRQPHEGGSIRPRGCLRPPWSAGVAQIQPAPTASTTAVVSGGNPGERSTTHSPYGDWGFLLP